ncbi:allophanate hydrolase [Dietzia kunjamensis subsp. schimae]|uniref:Allophanate hydrolase n=1 Tax=Dietzia kunjamensis subsp. schimae TaxID=498198 RepID=A0ABY1MZQ3_9ACTN|nr:allophanate hydrolase [Dietzia kunjamensis]MBB1014773.1 allophanate hydrolase [Dietzia kunjamensis subsp. schimae]SMO60895.1 allophanate hydrolase [Dietzia kunjamensis subsp. schimae]
MSATTTGVQARGAAEVLVDDVLARLVEADRTEVFLQVRSREELVDDMAASLAAGGPLAGMTLAVKNNVDVAGLPTTAACPGYAYLPERDAVAVARLRAAGAVVLGATNLDQFATGLVGTRSPYGAVRAAHRPGHISGGSSSGSAVAVALGICDLAIGTDTAGSGRIPAALNGIVGIKPTLGVVSTEGVVPACASYDCVTVFARDVHTAGRATAVMAGGDGTRSWPTDTPLSAGPGATLAVPRDLVAMAPGWAEAFAAAVDRARSLGYRVVEIDLAPFLAAARLLYDGALVAERYEAVGGFLDSARDADSGVDPIVEGIVAPARDIAAVDLLRDRRRVEGLRREALAELDRLGAAALLVPTAPFHPTIAEVDSDPIALNSRMGTYTNFCNLFDLCAVAVPTGEIDEGDRGTASFGVTVVGRPFHDGPVADIAADLAGSRGPEEEPADPWPLRAGAPAVDLVVFGAHRRGGPLEHQLTSRGALWRGPVRSSADYRMYRLDTEPPKPGVLRHPDGAELLGERWTISSAALGTFLDELPRPMQLGRVTLEDGTEMVGFGCEPTAVTPEADDLTERGEWPIGEGRFDA